MFPFLRTISEDSFIAAEIDRLKSKYDRFEEWWEYGWKWRLARDPLRDAQRVNGTTQNVYMITQRSAIFVPSATAKSALYLREFNPTVALNADY